MNLSTVGTIISLAFAPTFLLYINYFQPDKSSLCYLSAKMVPTLYSFVFLSLFTVSVFTKKYLVLTLTKKFYKKELSTNEQEYLKRGDSYWMGVTLLNTIVLANMGFFAGDVLWAAYSSVGWYVYFFVALAFQILYGKLIHKL